MNRYARGKSTLISNMVNFLDDINILIVNIDLFTVSNNQTSLFILILILAFLWACWLIHNYYNIYMCMTVSTFLVRPKRNRIL